MRYRLVGLRLLAVFALISGASFPGRVGALEEHTLISILSRLMTVDECPWGSHMTDGQCQPIEVPAHAFLVSSGRYWECERGYRRTNHQCILVKVPAHAFLNLSGHDWECEREYQRSGNRCVKVNVPAHAYLDYFGHDWVCERGYQTAEDQCVPIKLPAHAHLDYTGNDWECKRGYERVNGVCEPLWVQLKTLETRALVSSPEARRVVKQLQSQLKQAGYDPGPIDGLLGPKTIAALQHYMEAQERALAKTSSTQSRAANGT